MLNIIKKIIIVAGLCLVFNLPLLNAHHGGGGRGGGGFHGGHGGYGHGGYGHGGYGHHGWGGGYGYGGYGWGGYGWGGGLFGGFYGYPANYGSDRVIVVNNTPPPVPTVIE